MKSAAKMKAYYHLPGLFEFDKLYRVFLPLFRERREFFYDWCDIGSIYGAPADCLWGGGRVGFGEAEPKEIADLMREFDVEVIGTGVVITTLEPSKKRVEGVRSSSALGV